VSWMSLSPCSANSWGDPVRCDTKMSRRIASSHGGTKKNG
jgi:hypothetical protein